MKKRSKKQLARDAVVRKNDQVDLEKRSPCPRKKSMALSIVATDASFEKIPATSISPEAWLGRCIHCNTKFVVERDGSTSATIEHITPKVAGGNPFDPKNLALACSRCNNEKGIRHDKKVGRGGRADQVVAALQEKREARWKEAETLYV